LFSLKGQTILVMGASSGLGKSAVECYCMAGAHVIMAARNKDALEAYAKELSNVTVIQLDIRRERSVHKAFRVIEDKGLQVDTCLNNAGTFQQTPLFDQENHGFEEMIQTNLMGTWYMTKAAACHMRKNKRKGSIIQVSSVNGANYLYGERAGYCVAKAGVIHLTKALVGELSSWGIRINTLVPGLFQTPATQGKIKTSAKRQSFESKIPLGLIAQPRDLWGALLFFASYAASRYVTGTTLTLDGGISWGGA